MTYLAILLIIKITVTIVLIIIPFLFFKTETLDRKAGFGMPNTAMYRLYGIASLALVVAYSGGFLQALSGVYPGEIVAMGTFSNVGAVLVMLTTGYAQTQKIPTILFAFIAVGFVFSALLPDIAMQPIL